MASKSKQAQEQEAIAEGIRAAEDRAPEYLRAVEAAAPPPTQGRTFDGLLIWVDCPLYPATETSPQLRVGFRVDALWGQINEIHDDDPETEGARKIAAVTRKWEGWDFMDAAGKPIPPPNPNDVRSYLRMVAYARDLVDWIPVGYKAAMEKHLGTKLGETGALASLVPSTS